MDNVELAIELINSEEDVEIKFFEDLVVIEEDEDSEEVFVGRTSMDEYIYVPKIAGEIVNYIKQGLGIRQIEDILINKDMDVELKEFIVDLISLNYINKVNYIEIESWHTPDIKGITFKSINQKSIKWIFNKYTGMLLFIMVIIATIIQVRYINGTIVPTYDEMFWHSSLLLVVICTPIFDVITGFIHEFFHFLAIRAYSDNLGYLSLGRRLTYLVYQTRLKNIWTIPRKKRAVVYLAGIFVDLFIISIFIFIGFVAQGRFLLLYRFSRFAMVYLLFGIIFQFKFYMKTDLYYLISDFFKMPTLYEDAVELIKQKTKISFNGVHRNVIIYSVFMLLGSCIDIVITILYFIPSIKYMAITLISSVKQGNVITITANSLSVLYMVIELGLVMWFFIKEKKTNRTLEG